MRRINIFLIVLLAVIFIVSAQAETIISHTKDYNFICPATGIHHNRVVRDSELNLNRTSHSYSDSHPINGTYHYHYYTEHHYCTDCQKILHDYYTAEQEHGDYKYACTLKSMNKDYSPTQHANAVWDYYNCGLCGSEQVDTRFVRWEDVANHTVSSRTYIGSNQDKCVCGTCGKVYNQTHLHYFKKVGQYAVNAHLDVYMYRCACGQMRSENRYH